MFRSICVSVLSLSLAAIVPPAFGGELISVQEMTQRDRSLSQKLIENLENPEAQKKLAEYGISKEEAKSRIAALSDQEIKDLLNSKASVQAGGDIVIGLTTLLLIIIIILLVR